MKNNYCEQCGKIYEVCTKCSQSGVYKWRLHFCSVNCFRKSLEGDIEIMRIQYESKLYGVKDYDIKNGKFTTSNGLELKEDEIQGFILSLEQYKELKEFKYVKHRVKKEENTEGEVE